MAVRAQRARCARLRALLEQFGTPEAVYCASDAEYPSDIRPDGRTSLADKELAPARQILQQCYRQCIHIVTLQDAVYPQRLKNIDDAPLVLYYQGVLPDFDAEPVIAMVGTRRASAYGLLQAKRLGYELGRYGAIVVSGGAAGIDTLALRGAVSSGTPPVAVFACGVDVDYPAANRSLFEDLRTNGCVMSELPPGTPPLPEHFPSRNRILSGLAPRFRRGRGTEKERRAHHSPPRARAGKGRIHPPRQPRQSHLRGQHPAAQAGRDPRGRGLGYPQEYTLSLSGAAAAAAARPGP